jgi:hypothetical protein
MKKAGILLFIFLLDSNFCEGMNGGYPGITISHRQDDPEYFLGQNYPNPFNPTTTINYSLNKASNVKIEIHNLIGQKIKTLENGFKSPGKHSVVWDATDDNGNPAGSGIYFYRLEAGEVSFQKKMVLIR